MNIQIAGTERPIPAGVELLDDDLYTVPFDLLSLAEEGDETDEYQWSNPRRFGENDTTYGCGLDREEMDNLYDDLKDEGLMFPLICRWHISDENLSIQVLDGERRWRCLKKQIEKKEKVWSRKEKSYLPADQVHSRIPCRIVSGNDKEALKIAFMVSDRSVSWGEGATAKLIRKLRNCNCPDQEILELTKKSSQWLREQDKLCELDDFTFSYLEDGKINRALALVLAGVEDVSRRHTYLKKAYDDAVSKHSEILAKADAELEKSENKEEVAEATLEEAKITGSQTDVNTATVRLDDARKKTESKRRQRADASHPRAKTANLRNGNGDKAEEVLQPLRPGKIRKNLEIVNKLIDNHGKDESGNEILSLDSLNAVSACFRGILMGEEDVMKTLHRHRNFNKLQQQRGAAK